MPSAELSWLPTAAGLAGERLRDADPLDGGRALHLQRGVGDDAAAA